MKYIPYTHMSYNHTEICTMVSSQYSKTHGHTTVSTTLDKKVEHLFLGLPSSCGKKTVRTSPPPAVCFGREPRMVLAEGRLLFSCLGVVGDIRYSNDLGLMKRHGKRLYFYKGSRELFGKILLQS